MYKFGTCFTRERERERESTNSLHLNIYQIQLLFVSKKPDIRFSILTHKYDCDLICCLSNFNNKCMTISSQEMERDEVNLIRLDFHFLVFDRVSAPSSVRAYKQPVPIDRNRSSFFNVIGEVR